MGDSRLPDDDADVTLVHDAQTGDVDVAVVTGYGPFKTRVGCATAAIIAFIVIVAGGVVAYSVRDTGHGKSKSSETPASTEPSPTNANQTSLAGVTDPAIRAAIADAVNAGTVKIQATTASDPTEFSKKGQPAKAATVPGTKIEKLVVGSNIDLRAFQCGSTATVCTGGPPLTGKAFVFAAETNGPVPQPDAQHKVSYGLALQDHAQLTRGNIFLPAGQQFDNDWFQNATSGYSVFNQGGKLSLNYSQAVGSRLVAMPTSARFFESGNMYGFVIPQSAIADGDGYRMDVFRGDNQYGLGTGNWSGTYTPAKLNQFLVYTF